MQCSRPNQVFASPTEKYSGTLELDFSHSQQRIEELPFLFKVGARSDWLPSVTTQRYFQHLRKRRPTLLCIGAIFFLWGRGWSQWRRKLSLFVSSFSTDRPPHPE